QFWSRRL
ncbi:hypothetical protein VCHENC02_2566B, partial [Vibrio harveyi]